MFREERIEWDLNSETRTDEKVIERVRRCPAVVFGPYILAGWGELAIADEENRQRDKQIHATKTASAKQHRTLAFVLAAVAITVMSFSVWATPIVASLAILIGLSAMFTSASAAHFALSARGLLSTGRVMLHGGLMGSIVFAIQSLVYSVLHRSLAAFGMAALFALIASIAFAVKAKQKELENFRVD